MKSTLIKALAFILMAGLTACVTQTRVPPPKFDAAEFEPYAKKGTGKIYGQGFLKTRSGDVKFGAGSTVTLYPNTMYLKAFMGLRSSGALVDHTPEALAALTAAGRTTVGDGNGNFEFTDLPPGEYRIEMGIYWQYVASAYSTRTTGGTVAKTVTLAEGQSLKVIMTE